MRASPLTSIARPVIVFTALVATLSPVAVAQTQQAHDMMQMAPALPRDTIVAFAKLNVTLSQLKDSAQAQLAQPRNGKAETQQQIRDDQAAKIAETLHRSGVTENEFRRKTYIVSTDAATRRIFDSVVAQVSGVPTPGQLPPAAPKAAAIKVPAGPVGTHIGHVVNGFGDTPGGQGLLPVAFAEARIAITHASLAARAPTNLDAMKLHAGHVINAVDPTIIATGPGLGYGVKKAALGVATHIELAAKAQGASANVIAHAAHVSMSARNTVTRCDQIVALAQKIQAATTAEEAASLLNQLVPLTQQLVSGFDANGDGKVTWEAGEGGLQQAQEHVNLMLAGEHLP